MFYYKKATLSYTSFSSSPLPSINPSHHLLSFYLSLPFSLASIIPPFHYPSSPPSFLFFTSHVPPVLSSSPLNIHLHSHSYSSTSISRPPPLHHLDKNVRKFLSRSRYNVNSFPIVMLWENEVCYGTDHCATDFQNKARQITFFS